MATQTKLIAQYADPSNVALICKFEIDYDDVSMRVTKFRCVNNTTKAAWTRAARASNQNVKYERTFAAGETFEVTVPTTAANRLQLALTASGKLDGVEYSIMYPA